jgi:PTS system fructose-specific IIC component
MQLMRYLKPEHVRLGLVHGHLDGIDPEKDPAAERARLKEAVIDELVELFDRTGVIRNASKFAKDLRYRESQSSTALGDGIAVPHARSLQPRRLAIVFARSREGVWYDAPDGKPVHIFFGIAGPSYDEREFLQFYKWIAQSWLQEEWLPQALLEAEDEHEVVGILGSLH